jgi:hypothetical protein
MLTCVAQKKTVSPSKANPFFYRLFWGNHDRGSRHAIVAFELDRRTSALNQPAFPQHRLHGLVHQKIRERLGYFVEAADHRLQFFQIA